MKILKVLLLMTAVFCVTRENFPCLCILTPGHIIKNQVPTIIYYSVVSKSISLFSHSYFAKLYYLNKRVDPVVQAII